MLDSNDDKDYHFISCNHISVNSNTKKIFFKKQKMLNSESGFFVRVTNVNIVTIQIRNAFAKLFVISKNLKIDNFMNYAKEKCYLANSKQKHLIIVFDAIDLKKNLKTKTILQNGVTIYKNDETVIKIASILTIIRNFSRKSRTQFEYFKNNEGKLKNYLIQNRDLCEFSNGTQRIERQSIKNLTNCINEAKWNDRSSRHHTFIQYSGFDISFDCPKNLLCEKFK